MALLVLLPMAAMNALDPVPNLDLGAMQRMIMTHDKVLLLMFMKGCSKLEQIVPTLDAVAREVPELAFGRADVAPIFESRGGAWKASFAEHVQPGSPKLKAFFRLSLIHI